jgi:acetyltransferase
MITAELMDPRAIIVVGASSSLSKPGGALLHNIKKSGFKGVLLALNPSQNSVQGVSCLKWEEGWPLIDLALIAIPGDQVLDAVSRLLAKGIRNFIVCSSGFSEISAEGRELEQKIVQLVTEHHGCLIGPNCIGVITPSYGAVFAGMVFDASRRGVDFVSGSGAAAMYSIEKGIEMGIPFTSMLSLGNSAQIGVEHVVRYWDETYDAHTSSRVKLLYFEKLNDPQMLLKHAASLRRKGAHIVAIKSGGSEQGARAASSHTGAMATSDQLMDALFAKAGMIRCRGREQMLTVAALLLLGAPQGNRMAIVTQAGGPGVMATDAFSAGGMLQVVKLSETTMNKILSKLDRGASALNPIDFMATGGPVQIQAVLDILHESPREVDAMMLLFGDVELFDASLVYDDLIARRAREDALPVYPIFPTHFTSMPKLDVYRRKGGIYFTDEVAVADALGVIMGSLQTTMLDNDTRVHSVSFGNKALKGQLKKASGFLAPQLVAQVLEAAQIPIARQAVVTNLAGAVTAAQGVGFPLVMKVVGPIHKSDVGGVILGVDNEADLARHFSSLMSLEGAQGVMLQQQLAGLELYLGSKYEPGYGHLTFCGMGGTLIELYKDTRCFLGTIQPGDAYRLLGMLKSFPLLKGYRGKPGIDLDKFIVLMTRLASFLAETPEILEIDLNPILAQGSELVVVDARIKVAEQPASRTQARAELQAMPR